MFIAQSSQYRSNLTKKINTKTQSGHKGHQEKQIKDLCVLCVNFVSLWFNNI